ncbi:hypothetical protein OAH12_02250 [Cyclobacteriaceae bacterium]|nr:hypothetical protein [Cyclobacteriaceae bacterium]
MNRLAKIQLTPTRVFLLMSLILFFFGYQRFIEYDLYAEETIFLKEYYWYGLKSIVTPYAGYFHTIPRLITIFSWEISVHFFPLIHVISCTLITAFVLSRLSQSRYKWLFGSSFNRLLTCIILSTAAGYSMVFGNSTNIHWLLLLYLLILGLSSPKVSFTKLDLIFMLVALLSESVTFLVIPFFLCKVTCQL